MGRPKGILEWEGGNLATRAARALAPISGSVLVSIASRMENPVPSLDAVVDAPPHGAGPLAGIAAAFSATGRADLLVLACDYPFVTTPVLKGIRDAAGAGDDLVLPVDATGRDHPLVALWRRSAEPVVREALRARRYKVLSLLPDLEVRRVRSSTLGVAGIEGAFRNLNWPEDLAAARQD